MEKFTSIPKIDSDYEDKNNEGVTTGTLVDVESYQQQQVKSEKGPSVFTGRIRKLATFASLLLLSTKALASTVNIKLASPDAVSATLEQKDTVGVDIEKARNFLKGIPDSSFYIIDTTGVLCIDVDDMDSTIVKSFFDITQVPLGSGDVTMTIVRFAPGDTKNLKVLEEIKKTGDIPSGLTFAMQKQKERESLKKKSEEAQHSGGGKESLKKKAFGNWMVSIGFSLEMQASISAGIGVENSMGWQMYNLWSPYSENWTDITSEIWGQRLSSYGIAYVSDLNVRNASRFAEGGPGEKFSLEDNYKPVEELKIRLRDFHTKASLHAQNLQPHNRYGNVSFYTHTFGARAAVEIEKRNKELLLLLANVTARQNHIFGPK